MKQLGGHRPDQLALLKKAGAISRDTAVPVSFDGRYRPVTLSRMVDEGLTKHAQLPFNGDPKRRVSHYWLTKMGLEAAS